MSIEFARVHILSRSAGHSAVKAAAYRAGENLRDERVGRNADYSHRASEVLASKVLLPEGADQTLADRKTLWEAVEVREDQHNRRASAQLAKDHIIALPRELTEGQRQELAESFARSEFVSKGLVVDMAIHAHSEGNPHAHLMTTTRVLEGSEFGKKLREQNGKFYGGAKIADDEQLRHRWADHQNAYFKEHGIELSVSNNNGEFQAEKHLGAAFDMHKKGIQTSLHDDVQQIRTAREQAIFDRPEIIIERVANKKAVFTKYDLYRELNKVMKSPEGFQEIRVKLDTHESLIAMKDENGKEYLTTIDTLNVEQHIRTISDKLAIQDDRFLIKPAVRESVMKDFGFLSTEQKEAVSHLTGKERLGIVMGLAGAGKSTMLEAVRKIHEQSGHQVHGVALAGKAADELEKSAGISSSTITSFLYGIKSGRVDFKEGDVLVIDEFGMVSNQQTDELLNAAERVGAKVVVVGDTEQLQSIQTGAALRDLSQRHGYAGIETIRRQSEQWQRDATFALAKGHAGSAISAYRDNGNLHVALGDKTAVQSLVADYLADNREGSKAVLAHRTEDVKALNQQIRAKLVETGVLGKSSPFLANAGRDEQKLSFELELGDEVEFKSADRGLGIRENDAGTFVGIDNGKLSFVHEDGRELSFDAERYSDIDIVDKADTTMNIDLSEGDRVLFTRNDNELGVKNGQLGTLTAYKGGHLSVKMDSGDHINFRQEDYSDLSHGYATTIHKSQGMTIDRSYVLGTGSMDKHLAYVAMSRHRDSMEIYTPDEDKLLYAVSRNNRQETALDFAESRGLALVSEAHSEAIDKVLTGQEVDGVVGDTAPDAISQEDYQRATQLLAAEQSQVAARLTTEAQEPVVKLREKLAGLNQRLDQVTADKPKPGIFRTKSFERKEDDWYHQVRVITAARNGVDRQIKNAQSGQVFVESQEKIQQEAMRQAAVKLPKESQITMGYEADIKLAELNRKLRGIEKDLSTARSSGDEKLLKSLLKQKTTVLNTLQNRKNLSARLGSKQKQSISQDMLAAKKELGLFKSRGLSRGR